MQLSYTLSPGDQLTLQAYLAILPVPELPTAWLWLAGGVGPSRPGCAPVRALYSASEQIPWPGCRGHNAGDATQPRAAHRHGVAAARPPLNLARSDTTL